VRPTWWARCAPSGAPSRWRTEIINHHTTGTSNGPTEGLNLLVKEVKRAGHGLRSFDNYRLRILLHAEGSTWPATGPPTPVIRDRSAQWDRKGPIDRRAGLA
jgi:hypothetical protein